MSSNERTYEASTASLAKQSAAVSKRDEALKYLAKEGQTIESLASIRKRELDLSQRPKGDNTLYLLMQQKIEEEKQSRLQQQQRTAILQKRQTIVRNYGKSDDKVISLSQSIETEAVLPSGWQKVPDSASGKFYYWNTVTNETSWTPPPPASSTTVASTSTLTITEEPLPAGWVQRVHPATQQMLYFHIESGRTVGERPISSSDSSANNNPPKSDATAVISSNSKKRTQEDDKNNDTEGGSNKKLKM